MISSNIKYVVGIDFGHGETAIGIYRITWGKGISAQSYDDPTIKLLNGDVAIPSVLLLDRDNDTTYIGDDAMAQYQVLSEGNVYFGVSFKKKISTMSPSEKDIFRRFIKEVKNIILNIRHELHDKNGVEEGNYVVFIARPSGWPSNEDELYINIAKEAGLPVIGIWPESRSSMIRFLHNINASDIADGTSISLNEINSSSKGCVLMDIGSSTTDFSYINNDMDTPIDDNGNDCGGQIIDELLLQYVLNLPSNSAAKTAICNEYSESDYHVLLYDFRKQKEATFRGSKSKIFTINSFYGEHQVRCKTNSLPIDSIIKLLEEGLDGFGIHPLETIKHKGYSPFVKDSIKSGFIPALREELVKFIKANITSSKSGISCFILTGGTTNIFRGISAGSTDYFKQSILNGELSEYSNLPIYFDEKPSTSVSNGLALTGRNYLLYKGCSDYLSFEDDRERDKAQGLKKELDELIKTQINRISATKLTDDIVNDITESILMYSSEVVSNFAGYHDNNPSLDDLKKDLRNKISIACSNADSVIKEHISKCTKDNLECASKHIAELVNSYTIQKVSIPSIDKYTSIKSISIDIDYDDILKQISTQLAEQVILVILFIILSPLVYLAWLISKGLDIFRDNPETEDFETFFSNYLQGLDDTNNDWIKSRGRGRIERERIQRKYEEKKDDFARDIKSKLKNELTDQINIIIEKGIKAAVLKYKEDAYIAIERIFS